ncbi:MAG: phosphatase PAP2 family protein [Actinomycetota bacterium]
MRHRPGRGLGWPGDLGRGAHGLHRDRRGGRAGRGPRRDGAGGHERHAVVRRPRNEGGFPSRHAASSTAIALVVARQRPVLGAAAILGAVAGLAARVAAADHDPLDVVAGAGLGAAVARITRRRRWRRVGTRR